MTNATLLAEGTELMNRHGIESRQFRAFLKTHKDNQDLMELLSVAMTLKRALCDLPAKPTDSFYLWLFGTLLCLLGICIFFWLLA